SSPSQRQRTPPPSPLDRISNNAPTLDRRPTDACSRHSQRLPPDPEPVALATQRPLQPPHLPAHPPPADTTLPAPPRPPPPPHPPAPHTNAPPKAVPPPPHPHPPNGNHATRPSTTATLRSPVQTRYFFRPPNPAPSARAAHPDPPARHPLPHHAP